MIDGVRRLEFIVKHFDFFGHDAVIDQLLRIHGDASASSGILDKIKALSDHKLVKTAGLISLTVNLLLMPPKIPEGIITYRGYAHAIVEHAPKLLMPPLKQITGPGAPSADEQSEGLPRSKAK